MQKKKVLSLLLATTMVCNSFAGCGSDTTAETTTSVEDTNESVSENTETKEEVKETKAGASVAQKEETVYVKTNSSGNVNEVIVSNWLKNTENTEQLTDSADLNNITNVKGSETFQHDGEKLVWDANGSDIYYQGTTEKELPVEMTIDYKLDGKEIKPEELAGKSGHVEIAIHYQNKSEQKVMIEDHEETIYTPFAVVSGMRLDNQKFQNVKVTNGTVVNDGNNAVVMGMAFPGLVDSLNGAKIDNEEIFEKIEEKIEIPSEVVVEADVENFEMGMILTMVTTDVTNALGLNDVNMDLDLGDITDSMDEFKQAGVDLVDGTSQLKDGASELANGSGKLKTGSHDLYNGVVKYTDGVSKVAGGATELDNGAAKLDSGATELDTGAGKLDSGAAELKNGIGKLDTGAASLSKGATDVQNGANQLKDGATKVNAGVTSVQTGAAQLSAGVNELVGQMGTIASGVGQAAGASSSISGGIDQLVAATSVQTTAEDASITAIQIDAGVSADQIHGMITGKIDAQYLVDNGFTPEQVAFLAGYINSTDVSDIQATFNYVATASAQGEAVQTANNTKAQINAAITTPGENGMSLQTGAQALSSSLNASYAQLSAPETAQKLQALSTGAAQLSQGVTDLKAGTDALQAGSESLYAGTVQLGNGAKTLQNGTGQLLAGASTLKDGTASLKNGTSTLKNGTSTLKNGTQTLASGANELNANSASLLDGSKKLAEGTDDLETGCLKLLDGTVTLNEGMVKFDEEGIQKLTDLFDTDYDGMKQRLNAIIDAAKGYQSFSGNADGEDSSVKFIIESDAIKL